MRVDVRYALACRDLTNQALRLKTSNSFRAWLVASRQAKACRTWSRIEERFCLKQVRRIESFGEAVVDLCENISCFLVFVLVLIKARQTHPRAKLIGFRVLLLGNPDGLMKTRFGLGSINGFAINHCFFSSHQ